MALKDFIRTNREELDAAIDRALGGRKNNPHRNDKERRLWIMNDESLYLWAKSEGVRI